MQHGAPRLLTDRELGNFARFLRRSPEGAFDAAMRKRLRSGIPLRAFGKGGALDSAGPMDEILDFCRGRGMSDADCEKLGAMLGQQDQDDDADTATDADWSNEDEAQFQQLHKRRAASGVAEDEPEPFPGRPRPGGTMDPIKPSRQASDSRQSARASDLEAFKARIGDTRTIRVLG
jgi:hypothetical protein